MNTSPFYLKSIKQKTNHAFVIEWSDGMLKEYRLSDLQKHCPCAGCINKSPVEENVIAIKITNSGRYALRIEFSSGCSNGIYSYEMLRSFCDV